MSASNCARIMRVMAARARAQVRRCVFEKAHALMKRIHITCNGKYTENHQLARANRSALNTLDTASFGTYVNSKTLWS